MKMKKVKTNEEEIRFNIEELISYLPKPPKKSTIYQWIHYGKIPHRKIPGTAIVFFLKREIDEWMMAPLPDILDTQEWMDIKALQAFLPSHPPIQRIYKWIHFKKIPFYKATGTQLIHFRKSEILEWMMGKEIGK